MNAPVQTPVLSELGYAALAYAERGWKVFPLEPGRKLPLYGKADGGNGHLDATTDPEMIQWWWGGHPEANIGLNLARSGLMAIDADIYKPDCGWHEFVRGRDLPETLVQRTARGGVHYIHTAQAGEIFPGTLCPGVEIKHEGYIVLEPSVFEGKPYVFENDADPAPAPEWVPRKAARQANETGSAKKKPFIDTSGFGEAGIDEVREALTYIDPDLDYHRWVGALMALHHHLGDVGLTLAIDWSERGAKYVEGEIARKWPGLQAGRGHTINFVFSLAREAGCDLGELSRKHRSGSAGSNNHGGGAAGAGGAAAADDVGGEEGDAESDTPNFDAPTGFKGLLTSAEFIADWQPPEYLVDGILQIGMCYTLCGNTGHGKTAVGLNLTASVATGALFAGLEVCQGSVLFFAGENPDNVKTQWIALCADLGLDPNRIAVHFHPGPFSLRLAAAALAEAAARIPNLRLIVIDTLQAFFGGGDDNSNIEMLEAARQFCALTKLPGNPTVIVPAHPVKKAARDNLVPRGGSSFLNEIDGNLSIWATEEKIATLDWQGKFRGASFEPISFELVRTEPPQLVNARGKQMFCTVARPLLITRGEQISKENDSREDRALLAIRGNPRVSVRALADQIGGSPSAAKRLLDKLLALKWIKKRGRAWVLTDQGEAVLDG